MHAFRLLFLCTPKSRIYAHRLKHARTHTHTDTFVIRIYIALHMCAHYTFFIFAFWRSALKQQNVEAWLQIEFLEIREHAKTNHSHIKLNIIRSRWVWLPTYHILHVCARSCVCVCRYLYLICECFYIGCVWLFRKLEDNGTTERPYFVKSRWNQNYVH